MIETRTVELDFLRGSVTRDIEIGVLANDEVAVEVARTKVVDEQTELAEFRTGRVIA